MASVWSQQQEKQLLYWLSALSFIHVFYYFIRHTTSHFFPWVSSKNSSWLNSSIHLDSISLCSYCALCKDYPCIIQMLISLPTYLIATLLWESPASMLYKHCSPIILCFVKSWSAKWLSRGETRVRLPSSQGKRKWGESPGDTVRKHLESKEPDQC